MTRRNGRRDAGTVWLTVTALLAAVAASGLLALWWVRRDAPGALRDLDGNEVALAGVDAAASMVEETGDLLRVPDLDLSVPLLSAVVVDGVMNPPTLTDAYWYREFGDPDRAGSGTVVVAMHAVRGGRGPGNALVEPGGGGRAEVRIARGDLVAVGDARYRVRHVSVLSKAATASDARIWSPGRGRDRLALVTCLVDTSVPLAEQDNLVVMAERVA